jgi:hypothetical protein
MRVAFITVAIAAIAGLGMRQSSPPPIRDLLREIAALTDREWTAIERGEAIAKVLDTDAREVAVAGAVRIAASSERLVERYRDVQNLKRSSVVLDAGRLGQPPTAADLARVPIEDYSLDLRDCRPFDCRVRLSEPDINRFHRDVDWRSADWRQRSAVVWREVLAARAADYGRGGRRALPVLVNKREPLSVATELAGLVREARFLGRYAPDLFAYMAEFAPPAPGGVEQTLYWSTEDFGVRPVLRISHQLVYMNATRPAALVVVTNQVYADHYLDAALIVTVAIDGPTDRPGFYLVSVSRARTRSLTGFLRTFVRSTVQSRSEDALRKILVSTRTGLETPAR